ncbi:MAG: hypothetical protein QW478_00975 [Candidatus Micrarchaeaceae archaeon]
MDNEFYDFWMKNFGSEVVDVNNFIDVFYNLESESEENVDKNSWILFAEYFEKDGKINFKDFEPYIIYDTDYFIILKEKFYNVMKEPAYVNINKEVAVPEGYYIIKPENGFFAIVVGNKEYQVDWNEFEGYNINHEEYSTFFSPLLEELLDQVGNPKPYFINYDKHEIRIEYDFKNHDNDVVIQLLDGQIEYNKTILMASGEIFYEIFKGKFKKWQPGIPIPIDETLEDFTLLINFIENKNIYFTLSEEQKYTLLFLCMKYFVYVDYNNLASYLNISNAENFGELANHLMDNRISTDIIASMINENTNIEGINPKYLQKIAKSRYLGIKNFNANTPTVELILKYI